MKKEVKEVLFMLLTGLLMGLVVSAVFLIIVHLGSYILSTLWQVLGGVQ